MILLIIIVVFLIIRGVKRSGRAEDPVRRAGKRGEEKAANVIRSVLREDDHLFTNVEISHDGKPAELDNVIVKRIYKQMAKLYPYAFDDDIMKNIR